MAHSGEQKEQHRKFLLGNLPEQQAQALEERGLLEPDLAEDLQIEEEELIADYHSGTLSAAEQQLFERKYHSTVANKRLLEYEGTFIEFVASKSPESAAEPILSVDTARHRSVETERIEPLTKATHLSTISWWFRSLLTSRRVLAYSTAAIGFVLIAVALWYLLLVRNGPSHSAQRREAEAALAALNTPEKIATAGFDEGVELKPIQRFSGEIVRVGAENVTADGLIPFRLSVTEATASEYDATFVDEKRNELFTVPNIAVRSTASGPQVWVIVPVKYLTRGDYQIELSAAKTRTTTNSYPFRITLQD